MYEALMKNSRRAAHCNLRRRNVSRAEEPSASKAIAMIVVLDIDDIIAEGELLV